MNIFTLFLQRMAANTSHPWVPMTGAKHPSGGGGGGGVSAVSAAHPGQQPGQPPAVITLDDDRRRHENAVAEIEARRAQDRFMSTLSRTSAAQGLGPAPPPSQPGLSATSPNVRARHTPPPAHGHPMAAHGGQRPAPGVPPGGHDSRSPMSQASRPHPTHPQHPGHPGHSPGLSGAPVKQHVSKPDPGPPPPLVPNASRGGQPPPGPQPGQPGQPGPGLVSFKPYDFARRNMTSPHRSSAAYGPLPGADPRTHPQAYPPQPYSAPPVTSRPVKVTSPQVVMSVYSKPTNTPARPESSPAMQQGSSSGSVSGGPQAPPPAHGGAPRIPSYLPPPPPALSSFPTGIPPHGMPMSNVRQHLPAPTLHGSSSAHPQGPNIVPHSSHHVSDEQPLDLGAPTKRKVPEVESEASPAKAVKLEPTNTTAESCNGILFKVSEPSVLSSSEASNITTIENMAIKKEEPSTPVASSLAPTEVKTESPTSPVYVHKLKKAWIKSYTDHDDEPKAKKAATAGTSDCSAPSTPSNTRATPSPALSNASKSGIKVNGHNKLDNESESSDSSSHATNKGQKHSSHTGSKGHRGGGRGGGRGGSRLRGYGGQTSNKTSDNDAMSDSDDCSKDSDATTSSRRSTNGGNKGRRGRKPKRGRGGSDRGHNSAASTSSKQDYEESRENFHRTGSESRENGNGNGGSKKGLEKENPFNNPPIHVLKKTGESFLQDSDCFKVAPKLAKCRECKWSQHNKNAGSSASIFCR